MWRWVESLHPLNAQQRPQDLPVLFQTRRFHICIYGRGQRSAVIERQSVTSCNFCPVRPPAGQQRAGLLFEAWSSAHLHIQSMGYAGVQWHCLLLVQPGNWCAASLCFCWRIKIMCRPLNSSNKSDQEGNFLWSSHIHRHTHAHTLQLIQM